MDYTLSLPSARVQSLVGELKTHKLYSTAKKTPKTEAKLYRVSAIELGWGGFQPDGWAKITLKYSPHWFLIPSEVLCPVSCNCE